MEYSNNGHSQLKFWCHGVMSKICGWLSSQIRLSKTKIYDLDFSCENLLCGFVAIFENQKSQIVLMSGNIIEIVYYIISFNFPLNTKKLVEEKNEGYNKN
jgi:hypothetical protein